jgi:two-component system sensor histidine kinase RegB
MILSPPDAVAQDHRAARPPRQGAGVPGERLRLRTLVTLRWGAMGGQLLAIVLVRIVLGFDFPVVGCLGMIALSALLNLGLLLALPSNRLMFQWEASAQLGFDIFQLTGLLVLTGGVGNPFVVLLLVPVSLAASSLKGRDTLLLAGLAVAALFVLAAVSMPLPWFAGTSFAAPALYRWIAAAALAICIAVTATYARRAAAESARMELALHAAEAVLAREQRMSALGGLAAAAAHELGTPLATIAIVAKEMSRESPPGPMREDAVPGAALPRYPAAPGRGAGHRRRGLRPRQPAPAVGGDRWPRRS